MVIDRKNKRAEIRAVLRRLIVAAPLSRAAAWPKDAVAARARFDWAEGGQSSREIGKAGTHTPRPVTSINAETAAVARIDKRASTRNGLRP
jgi:hypothetical protein